MLWVALRLKAEPRGCARAKPGHRRLGAKKVSPAATERSEQDRIEVPRTGEDDCKGVAYVQVATNTSLDSP
jgi:hypothetical protein